MPRDSAAADRPASYLVGTAAAFPLFFPDRTKPINQLPFSPSAKFPKSGSSCESRAKEEAAMGLLDDVLRSAVPGGNVSKPLMVALTALLAAGATGSGGLGSLLGGGGA